MQFGLAGIAWGAAPVDLNTWSKKGPGGSGNWTVAGDGTSVFQSINGNPTFFVSPADFYNTTVVGSFGVETTGDDDYIGFVFGYQTPQGTVSTDYDFLLFDWKQGNQSGSSRGFTLSRVQGNNTIPFANHQVSAAGYDVWASNIGTGWADNTFYDFTLLYQAERISIDIAGGVFGAGATIFDVIPTDVGLVAGSTFPNGQFGFYNYSQSSVRYRSFTQTDDPILVTDPAHGGTLDLGLARVGTTSGPGTLTITNGAAVGSTLTGTVGAASGEFVGPAPDANFSLAEGDSAEKTFTYAPTGRGVDTQDIDVTSDGGNATITLQGTGVGPVFDSSIAPGATIDLGPIGIGETGTAALDLSNITPDAGDAALTDLTLDYTITGPDAALFGIDLIPLTTVAKGGTLNLQVTCDPLTMAPLSATLTILTDEGVPLGQTGAGNAYTFELTGEGVPEPTMLSLMGLGGLALLRRRRR